MAADGYGGQIAIVDLSSGHVTVESTEGQPLGAVLGGRGLAHALLEAHLPTGVAPLSPDNVLVFAPGALVGTNAPSAGRWNIAAKSPLTGILGSGNAGGYWGAALKWAGFDALVVKGCADSPCYLHVQDGQVNILPAGDSWGLDTRQVVTALRGAHRDPQLRVAAIGPAGERLVPMANIIAEERSGGRGGLGAVMGSKQLKAVAVHGEGWVRVADPKRLNRLVAEAVDDLRKEGFFANYRRYGSNSAVKNRYGVLGGMLPYNGTRGVYPELDRMGADLLADRYVVRSNSCAACPFGCLKVFDVKEGEHAGSWGEGVQTGTLIGFGVRCGMTDMAAVLRAHAISNSYGLDMMSTEATIAFAIECFQKGIIGPGDTEGLELSWDNDALVVKLAEQMGRREGFGALLGLGTRELARRWGSQAEKIALHVKGMETTPTDARAYPTWGLMYAVSSRGADHMRAYCSVEFGEFPPEMVERLAGTPAAVERFAVEGKGKLVAYFEEIRGLADCLGLCKWVTRRNFGAPERLVGLVEAVQGRPVEAEELRLVGERLINAERLFNLREGLTPADDNLPPRFLNEPITDGPAAGHVADLAPMLAEYYAVRDWDMQTGWPSAKKLAQLGLKA